MKQLHPGAKWVFRFRVYPAIIVLLIWFLFMISASLRNLGDSFVLYLSLIILFVIVFAIIFAEIYARMAYKRWLYKFEDDNLRLERGIIWKRYSNVPYERVQNVDISRGIFARMFGYSTVNIQTAGFHAAYGRGGVPKSEGYIPAVSVDEAEQIRSFLMKKISRIGRSQGL